MYRVDQHNVIQEESKSLIVQNADRTYPLRISDTEEEDIVEMVREVNNKIKEFQHLFPKKDRFDSVVMTLLTMAVELKKLRNQVSVPQELYDRVGRIESAIQSHLNM